MARRSIPFMQFRGGSSKGLFFKAEDLPDDRSERNHILQAMEGVGKAMQDRSMDSVAQRR
jgi:4-oxalomesaconate tautomerase